MHDFIGGRIPPSAVRDVGALRPPREAATTATCADRDAELDAVQRALDGRFELLGRLGCGATGSVFEALDRRAGGRVAIKALRTRFQASPDLRARFRREAAIIARFRHPNVVALRELYERDGILFMVLDLVGSECLAQRLEGGRRLPPSDAARVMRDLASALVHVHAAGVVHRDVKPDNVLLASQSGRAVLTDFGIAALPNDDPWGAGWAPGTPHYMSPEQSDGRGSDARCDIYALGVVGYRMLAGVLPFDGSDAALIAAGHRDLAPPPLQLLAPEAPASMLGIVEKCLAKRPSQRFHNAAALRGALAEVCSTSPGPDRD